MNLNSLTAFISGTALGMSVSFSFFYLDKAENLLLEIIGSLLFSATITLGVTLLAKKTQNQKMRYKADVELKFNLVKSLSRQFQRNISYNYKFPNHRCFFDNTMINGIYDRFKDFESKIYSLETYIDDNETKLLLLLKKLNTFANSYEEAEIEAEKIFYEIQWIEEEYVLIQAPPPLKSGKTVINFLIAATINENFGDYSPESKYLHNSQHFQSLTDLKNKFITDKKEEIYSLTHKIHELKISAQEIETIVNSMECNKELSS